MVDDFDGDRRPSLPPRVLVLGVLGVATIAFATLVVQVAVGAGSDAGITSPPSATTPVASPRTPEASVEAVAEDEAEKEGGQDESPGSVPPSAPSEQSPASPPRPASPRQPAPSSPPVPQSTTPDPPAPPPAPDTQPPVFTSVSAPPGIDSRPALVRAYITDNVAVATVYVYWSGFDAGNAQMTRVGDHWEWLWPNGWELDTTGTATLDAYDAAGNRTWYNVTIENRWS